LKPVHRLVGSVHGRGLVIGVELLRDQQARTPAAAEADRLLYACLVRGLSFKITGGNVVSLTPPLTLSESELDQALDIFTRALIEIETAA